jgi:hypothetical protein
MMNLKSAAMDFQSISRVLFLAIAAHSSLCFGSMIFYSASQDSLYVGDRVHVGVALVVPPGSQVTPPPTDNGFGKLSVKEWTSDKTEKKSADSLTFHYAVTTYTAEPCTLPALDFIVTKDKTTETLHTQSIPMRVLLVSSPDTAAIKDLKPQQNAGKPSLAWLWIVAGAALIAAAIFFGRRFFTKAAKPTQAAPPKPPYEEALEALGLLEAKNYVAKGMIREYVFELSEIIKRYLERRFAVQIAEFTTQEILDWVKASPLGLAERKTVDWFFSTTDPVKFAKWLPDNDTVSRFGADMRAFVEKTKPAATPVPAAKTEAGRAS